MIIKVSRTKILQYISIYGMLLLCGSKIWVITQKREAMITLAIELIIIILGIMMTLGKTGKKCYARDYLFLIMLSAIVAFVRFRTGGAGLTVLLEWALYVFCVRIAIEIDKKSF